MAQQQASVRILAGAFTCVGLGLVWMAIVGSLPSQQELSAKEPFLLPHTVPAAAVKMPSEPSLDLSIPGVPAAPPALSEPTPATASSAVARLDRHAAQVARLRCEAEAEQLCPGLPDGLARTQCLERRMPHLTAPCQLQVRERFVKWKEERSRLTAACEVDMKRFCSAVKPGGGHVLQCLQAHAQELSDRCYETLPKGTVYFKQ
jgi:cysteine rich repeat protein